MLVDHVIPVGAPLDLRAAARRAEHDGYDGIWVPEVRHDPFPQLALAATVTERTQLVSGIAVAFARNPMSLALSAHDVHALSGGRLLLGLGTQVEAHVTRRFSMPWSAPAARMREFVLALRAIWTAWETGERLWFRGEHYRHTLMTPMFTPEPHGFGAPPVLLAGVGARMTEVAGEVADGFVAHPFTTERYLREVTLPALARGRAAAEPRADGIVAASPFVVTGRTEEEAAAVAGAVRAQLAFYGSTPAYRPVLELHGWGDLGAELQRLSRTGRWAEMGALVDDTVLDAFALVGEPDTIAPAAVRRFGDVVTRLTPSAPGDALAPDLLVRIAADVRRLADPPG